MYRSNIFLDSVTSFHILYITVLACSHHLQHSLSTPLFSLDNPPSTLNNAPLIAGSSAFPERAPPVNVSDNLASHPLNGTDQMRVLLICASITRTLNQSTHKQNSWQDMNWYSVDPMVTQEIFVVTNLRLNKRKLCELTVPQSGALAT